MKHQKQLFNKQMLGEPFKVQSELCKISWTMLLILIYQLFSNQFNYLYLSQHTCGFSWWLQFSSVAQLCPTFCDSMNCACQASLSITNSWSLLKLIFIELVRPSNHLILCHLFSFSASGSFQMSQFLESGGHSIGVQLQHKSFQ